MPFFFINTLTQTSAGTATPIGLLLALTHVPVVGTPTGDGKMNFSLNPGNDTGLLALIEDI